MIRLEIRNGVQKLTEICDCILVKSNTDLIIKNSKGEVVTNTEPRPKCYCDHCKH